LAALVIPRAVTTTSSRVLSDAKLKSKVDEAPTVADDEAYPTKLATKTSPSLVDIE
jgi:hypothetical protein